jgi:lichenan operon transcriptional antiterminator
LIEKKKKLLRYLVEMNSPCSASELAEILEVSVRTVKTYIKDINSSTEKIIVHSSYKGYLASKNDALLLLNRQNALPQNYSERAFYMIKKILVEHKDLNAFDICNDLYISYSTLKNDLLYLASNKCMKWQLKMNATCRL